MLKLVYLVENFDLARLALPHWPHNEDTLAQRLRWFRISSNAVYPFDRAGRLCFLRLSPAGEKDAGELRGEMDFLTYLNRCGYPAMRPVPAENGEAVLALDTPWGRWYASAFEGVPGKPLEDVPMTDDLAREYGAALGRLHTLSMAYHPPVKRRDHADVLTWIARTLLDLGAPRSLLAEAEAVARLLDAMPKTPEAYGLVHYDFEPDNVFWDGGACHVIDFEDGMRHFYAVDAVQALDELPEAFAPAFLRGYRGACPESAVREADFPLMRRFRDLYSCARLRCALSERPAPEPDWMPTLVGRLTHRLGELEAGICGQ